MFHELTKSYSETHKTYNTKYRKNRNEKKKKIKTPENEGISSEILLYFFCVQI
jgi:hypothetical protein